MESFPRFLELIQEKRKIYLNNHYPAVIIPARFVRILGIKPGDIVVWKLKDPERKIFEVKIIDGERNG